MATVVTMETAAAVSGGGSVRKGGKANGDTGI